VPQNCCPVGQTIFVVVCACAGTQCDNATNQSNHCF
jgi:hypothetical protein